VPLDERPLRGAGRSGGRARLPCVICQGTKFYDMATTRRRSCLRAGAGTATSPRVARSEHTPSARPSAGGAGGAAVISCGWWRSSRHGDRRAGREPGQRRRPRAIDCRTFDDPACRHYSMHCGRHPVILYHLRQAAVCRRLLRCARRPPDARGDDDGQRRTVELRGLAPGIPVLQPEEHIKGFTIRCMCNQGKHSPRPGPAAGRSEALPEPGLPTLRFAPARTRSPFCGEASLIDT
jgi:hypothetical protein